MAGAPACLLTSFGATADLAQPMLLPSLCLLQRGGLLEMPIVHGLCGSIEANANVDQRFEEGRVFRGSHPRGRVGVRHHALVIWLQPVEQAGCSLFAEAAAPGTWRVAA